MEPSNCDELECLMRRDPAGRGIAAWQGPHGLLAPGQLRLAVEDLAQTASSIALVTGFVATDGDRVLTESDGPPGALFLAGALQEFGIPVLLITDRYTLGGLEAGCDSLGLPRSIIVEFPFDDPSRWTNEFLTGALGSRLSHLIAVERPGPNHTEASVIGGIPAHRDHRLPVLDQFRRAVQPEQHSRCYSMRGVDITSYVAQTHLLFERAHARSITTIGIGDGGNEIGMGSIPWQLLREAILLGPRDLLPCRIAADYTLLAGVSNWAAYALALGLAAARGRLDLAAAWTVDRERALLEHLARTAGVVDGITLRPEPTVDGLPTATYLEILAGMRETLGLEP